MSVEDPVVIIDAKRTAIGAFQGVYKNISAPELGANVIRYLIENNNIKDKVSEVIMGCVLSAGLGQAPARQAALRAGLDYSVPCTTVNKMCGSGLKSITLAYNNILANPENIIIAGGMESMTNAPYFIPKARAGLRLGHGQILDHMFYDGLEDAYNKGLLMGHFAERTAKKYNFTRDLQDEFAMLSASRAKQAVEHGLFKPEIAAVKYNYRDKEIVIDTDETPGVIDIDKIKKLKPAFVEKNNNIDDCTVTAANSSSISDGAAAVILMRLSKAKELDLKPIAKIINYSDYAQEPEWFTTAPVGAINNLIKKSNLDLDKIDLFEINEAFAVVTMAAIHDLKLDSNKVNIYGGACALGHPIGATGARILVTLLNSLERNNRSLGIASMCIGGGEASAIAIERI